MLTLWHTIHQRHSMEFKGSDSPEMSISGGRQDLAANVRIHHRNVAATSLAEATAIRAAVAWGADTPTEDHDQRDEASEVDTTVRTMRGTARASNSRRQRWQGCHSLPRQTFPMMVTSGGGRRADHGPRGAPL